MADRYAINKTTLDAIADQAQELNGTTAAMSPAAIEQSIAEANAEINSQAAQIDELREILAGKAAVSPVVEELTVTENGTYTPPSGTDGYAPVNVNVPTPEPVVVSLNVTENGTYEAPDGTDGYSPVTVNVPTPEPVTDTLDVTENGTYTAPEDIDGYSSVNVNVQPALQEKTVTPTKNAQIVTPDSKYYGLSAVLVEAISEIFQDVSGVTATAPDVLLGKIIVTSDGKVVVGTMPDNGKVSQTLDVSNVKYTFSAGYVAGGTIQIVLEEKTVTPTKSKQTITPDAGKVLSKLIIEAIPDNYQNVSDVTATAADVRAGKKIVLPDGTLEDGSIPDNGELELAINLLTQSSVAIPVGITTGGTVTVTDDLLNALKAI